MSSASSASPPPPALALAPAAAGVPSTVERLLNAIEVKLPPSALKTWQAVRSKYGPVLLHLERRYLQHEIAQRLYRATGVEPVYWSLLGAVAIVSIFWAAFKRASSLVANLVGFVYPAYQSVRAIENNDENEHKQWLSYWSLYAFFNCIEHFSEFLLSWVPMYYWIKLGTLVYCFHPSTRGAERVYNRTLHPLYQRYHVAIDHKILQGRRELAAVAQSTLAPLEDTLKEGLSASSAIAAAAAE